MKVRTASSSNRMNLAAIGGIPDVCLEVLNDFVHVIQSCEYLEDLLERRELFEVAQSLNGICLEKGIVGIHYTRAIRAEIEANGLQPSAGDERRKAFLDQHGHNFTDAQMTRIRLMWDKYFNDRHRDIRDNRIWFAFTLAALDNGGAARLLTYFGGEQIYMPLTEDDEIGAILKTLGEPLIVISKDGGGVKAQS